VGGERRVRILHISDLHARGAHDERRAWKRRRVLGDTWRRNLDELAEDGGFDLVAFTGDVADSGLAEEYAEATIFVHELLAHLKVPRERFFVVPGNHDIHRKTQKPAWRKMRKGIWSAPQNVSEWMADPNQPPPFGFQNAWRDAVLERESAFWAWVEHGLGRGEFLPGCSPHGRLGYRISLSLGGHPVHIIGLDSAWLAGDEADAGKLRLTEDQLGRLCYDKQGARLPGFRLALMHHPLSDLADADTAARLLADSVDLVLRGHQHTPVARKQDDPDHSLRELAAGCLYEGGQSNQYPNACQVIDAVLGPDGRPVRYDIRFRAWSPKGHWHNDGSLYREAKNGRLTWHVVDEAVPGLSAHKPRSASVPDTSPGPHATVRYRSMAQEPEQFIERRQLAEIVAQLEEAARSGNSASVAITTALRGSGGFGKTTLAQAVCLDERVRQAFPDGILWTTMGEHLTEAERLGRVLDLVRWWSSEEVPAFTDVTAASAELRGRLSTRRVLLVVDDVWQSADLEPFRGLGPGAALLVTTRDRRTLPSACEQIEVDAMRQDESMSVLGAGLDADPRALAGLAAQLGHWPLLLGLVNGQLRELTREHGLDVREAIAEVEKRLTEEGLTAFDIEDDSARRTAVDRTLGVSLRRLDDADRQRYERLAVFPEDADVPLPVLARCWGANGTVTRKLCERLRALSLLQRFDIKSRTIRLHDVFRRYLIDHQGERLATLHGDWLAAFRPASDRWHELPADESYAWRFLAYHLHHAGHMDGLAGLLCDFDWLEAKLHATSVTDLLADFALLPTQHDAQREATHVHDVLRLSSHILARDPTQLPGQLIGRTQIPMQGSPRIASLLDRARSTTRHTWLRPASPSLMPPGGPLIRTLAGHDSEVTAVALVPGDRRIVSASADHTLMLWDLAQGSRIRIMRGHTEKVSAIAVTPDGTRAVSASHDKTLKIWDLEHGSEIRTLTGHTESALAVAVLPDGKRAVSASRDKTLRLWDLERGCELRTLAGHTDAVTAVAVTADGTIAVSASADRTLKRWDLERGCELPSLVGHEDMVTAMAMMPDGAHLISASRDRTLKLWELAQGSLIRTLAGPTRDVTAMTVMPDGKQAISASANYTLQIWDLVQGSVIGTLQGHTDTVTALLVTADGQRAVSASAEHMLKIWDLGWDFDLAPGHTAGTSILGTIRAVAITPDGRHAITASRSRDLAFWDLATGAIVALLKGHAHRLRTVAITPDGKRAVSASADGTMRIWDLGPCSEIRVLTKDAGMVRAMAVLPDGKRVICALYDRTLQLWDLAQGSLIYTLTGHTEKVTAVAVTPDGERAVSASHDRTLKLWDLERGSEIITMQGHTDLVNAVAVLPDGKRAVSASSDHTLKLWDLERGFEIITMQGHTDWVRAVAVTPDGKRAVSASYDHTVKIWDLDTGQVLATFGGDGAMRTCAASPTGNVFVAGDWAGHLHILELIEPGAGAPASAALRRHPGAG
jgi:WD40 repeat protein/predicted MPP superfamily phosphohydrolase